MTARKAKPYTETETGVLVPTANWAGEMPWWDYGRTRAVRSSELRTAAEWSLAHMRQEQIDRNASAESDAFIRGRGLHACVLEPDTGWPKYHRMDPKKDWRRNTNAGKENRKEAEEEYGEPYLLTALQYDQVLSAREAIRAHSRLGRLLGAGEYEHTMLWQNRDSGLWCKGRADWRPERERRPMILDLKGTRDARPWKFAYSIRDYRYDLQGAHYLEGAFETGGEAKDYGIAAVEWTPPHGIKLYRLRERTLVIAETQRDRLLEQIARAEESGVWPNYPEETETIGLPRGTERALEIDLELEEMVA